MNATQAIANPAIPLLRTPTRTPAPPTVPGAVSPDQVTLSPGTQSVQAPNGVAAQITRDQHSLALKATLPAGPGALLAVPVELEIVQGPEPKISASAGGVELQGLRYDEDGKYYFYAQPGETMVVFDPQTLSYGLSAPFEADPKGGYTRERQETVNRDGSRTFIHNEHTGAPNAQGIKEKSYTRVDYRSGQLEACKVVDRGGKGPDPQQSFGSSMMRWATGKGLAFEVAPCDAKFLEGGRIQVSPSTSMKKQWDVYKKGLNSGGGWLTSFLGGGSEILTPFSASLAQPPEGQPAPQGSLPPGVAPGTPARAAQPEAPSSGGLQEFLSGWLQ